ncbi:MAG: amidohydrolase family protein [Cellulosilyticaceae bacterium]
MYLIKNGMLHIGDGRIKECTDILIEGSKIIEIGVDIKRDDANIIEADNMHVFPGFIDPHSSIGALGMPTRYMDNREATSPITPDMNIRYSIDPDEVNNQEFYKSGITTIGIAPDNSNIIGGQITVFKTPPMKMKERIVKDKAALKCSVAQQVKEEYGGRKQLPMTRMGIFYLLKETLRKAKSNNQDKLNASDEIILSAFDKGELPVFCAACTKGEITGLLHLLEYEKISLNIVDAFGFSDCIEEIKQTSANIILGNINNMSQLAKYSMNLSKVKELIQNGNLIAFSNTNGGRSEGREVFIWNGIEVYRAGVDAEEVVKMMCINPAKMLGVDDRIGSIEVGKDADISIFSDHPVCSYKAKVVKSFVNGEVII